MENDKNEGVCKLELNFKEEPIDRLKKEIDFYKDDSTKVAIGQFILEQLEKDEILKNNYKEKRFTINSCAAYITKLARKSLNNKDGCLEDKVIFGWIIHYLQDEPIENNVYAVLSKETKESLKAQAEEEYKEECIAKIKEKQEKEIRKAIDKENKARKKAEEEKEKYGEMSLFDI